MVEKSEDYTDNLCRCIIRKSASITNRFALPVLILMMGAIVFTMLIIWANRLTEIYQNMWGSLWEILNMVSLPVYLILLVVLPIPLYSTFWCIRHRRRLRELKVREEMPICPIDGFSQREKGV